ncbi:Alpha-L-fucosidase [Treponema phagedenis F0421]|nr:Alpha-L-fucosidase [Treponema phagedenis F0421]
MLFYKTGEDFWRKIMEEPIMEKGVHAYSEEDRYVVPKSAAVRKHLEFFTGLKFGLMMHWAPGCQIATYESWPLCDDADDWSREDVIWTDDMEEFKHHYWNANKTFNPIKFRPDHWADFAKRAGFKYLLFTTKHHDGFCMFDTQQTDYKITASDCPFSSNKRANIVQEVFNAFRAEGLAISAYFSKPDWHSEYFWAPEMGKAETRNANYDIPSHPELWNKFVDFTHQQLREICSLYGHIDVLWLDGGQISPRIHNQDIRLGEIVEEIRNTTQPHLIVCDRTVGGEYENIITPEQSIPSHYIGCPWEACITAGDYFSFHYEDNFKSPHAIVRLLIEVVSKGGNLALNIPPQPDGQLPAKAMRNLLRVGEWLHIHGQAIYNTRGYPIAQEQKIFITEGSENVFVFYCYDENTPRLPRRVNIKLKDERAVQKITCLRSGAAVSFIQNGKTLVIHTIELDPLGANYADCLKLCF